MKHHSLEAWPAVRLRPTQEMLDAACAVINHHPTEVDVPTIAGLPTVTCASSGEHTDKDFPRWSLLWILRHRRHTIHCGNQSWVPAVGDMILFDSHMQHRVTCDGLPEQNQSNAINIALFSPHSLVAINLERATRPSSRERAEALMAKLVSDAGHNDAILP